MSIETPPFNRYETAVLKLVLSRKQISPRIALQAIPEIESLALATNTIKRLEERGYLSTQQAGMHLITPSFKIMISKSLHSNKKGLPQPAFEKPLIKNAKTGSSNTVSAASTERVKTVVAAQKAAAEAKKREDAKAKKKAEADKQREARKAENRRKNEEQAAIRKAQKDTDKKELQDKAAAWKEEQKAIKEAAKGKTENEAQPEVKSQTKPKANVPVNNPPTDVKAPNQEIKSRKGSIALTLTKADCIKIAQGFKNKTEWNHGDRVSWTHAKKVGWYQECCAHMGKKKVEVQIPPPAKAPVNTTEIKTTKPLVDVTKIPSALMNIATIRADLVKALSKPVIDNVAGKTEALKAIADMIPDDLASIVNDICDDLAQ